MLLLLSFSTCTAEKPEAGSNADTIEKAVGDAGIEGSSFGSSEEAISHGSSETVQPALAETDEGVAEQKKVGTYRMIEGEDAILRGEHDSFCTEFLKNLQEFENEEFMACGMKFSSKYPEYRNLEWVKLDVMENKERLERFILGGVSEMPGESARISAINRIMERLLNGTTVAMEASIEGLFPEVENKILRISRSECSEGNAPYAFLLDAYGQDFEEFAPPSFRNKSGDGFNAGGNFFYYKNRLMNIRAETFSSGNNLWKSDGRIVIGDVDADNRFDAEGNVVYGNVVILRQCEYIWNQVAE